VSERQFVFIVLLTIAVIVFAIGAIRPGIGGVDWQSAGLAFAAAAFAVRTA
jgi:hypothetical protein